MGPAGARSEKPKVKGGHQLSAVSYQENSDNRKLLADSQFNYYSFFGLILLSSLFLMSNCTENFQPLEVNNDYNFSMYGVIDASVDTQWVRITPIREQIDLLTDGSDIQVTLQNLGSGQTIVMNDSIFQRQNVLNFWTDETIEHNQAYRLTAELPDRGKSEVTVQTPHEMPVPKIAVISTPSPSIPSEYFVLVDSSINLADIQTKYYVRLQATGLDVIREFSFSYRNLAEITDDFPGYYSVEIKPEEEEEEIAQQVLLPPEGQIDVIYRQVYVAASSEELDEGIESLDDVTYALPQTLRNVDMGLGYVLGIDSKYIPYLGCNDLEGNVIPCDPEAPYR